MAGVAKGVHTLACGGMCLWHVQAWWRQSPAPACQRVPACAGQHRHAACQCVPALGPMPPHTPQCTCMALGWPWVPLATRGGSRGQGAWPNVAPIGRPCKPPGQAAWPAVPGAARACGCLPGLGQPCLQLHASQARPGHVWALASACLQLPAIARPCPALATFGASHAHWGACGATTMHAKHAWLAAHACMCQCMAVVGGHCMITA